MSEVNRFKIEFQPERAFHECVYASDFDRVTAERDGLQISLNTADQSIDELNAAISRRTHRVRELEGLLRRVVDCSVLSFEKDAPEELESLEADICAALKPAEVRCNIPACDYQIDMDQN